MFQVPPQLQAALDAAIPERAEGDDRLMVVIVADRPDNGPDPQTGAPAADLFGPGMLAGAEGQAFAEGVITGLQALGFDAANIRMGSAGVDAESSAVGSGTDILGAPS